MERWSQIAELYIAANRIDKAFLELNEAASAFQSSGYPREFCRVARMLLEKANWIEDHGKFKGFEHVFQAHWELLAYLGQYSETERLLSEYERTVPNKDARYINYCKMRCTFHWIKGDFSTAVQWGRIGSKLKESGVDTEYDVSHALALAERDAGRRELALPVFLEGIPQSTVTDPAVLDEEKKGPYYGNIGRCLQFLGQHDAALVCYQKSALMIERDTKTEFVLNQGYIRYWIGEVLLARGQRELSKTFLRAA